MDNEDLLNAGAGYVAGSSISKGIANNLRKQREEMEKKLAHITSEEVLAAEIAKFLLSENRNGAYEYLNSHFNEEIIDAAQNQTDYIYSLETMLKRKKDKYNPFYERTGMPMPENLAAITANELCQILGVENLHIIDSTDGKTSPSHKSNSGCTTEMIISAIVLSAVIVIIAIIVAANS